MVQVDVSRLARVLPSRGVTALAAILLACSSGSSGPTSSGTAPRIASLYLWNQIAAVGEGGGAAIASFTFGVIDPDADVARVDVTVRDPGGAQVSQVQEPVTNPTGQTTGQIEGYVEVPTTAAGSFRVEVQAFDARGNASNVLSATFSVVEGNPVPAIASLTPERTTAGGPGFTLTVTGSGFVQGSTVLFDGSYLQTTYVDETTLRAQVESYRLYYTGTAQVGVTNPPPGGGMSATVPFTIEPPPPNPVPTLASLSPTSADAGTAGFTLTVTGTGFVAYSRVIWNDYYLDTTCVDETTLTATVPASNLQAPGTVMVKVYNTTPGGGTSASVPFTVTTPAQPGVTSVALKANDLAWDPYQRRIYASVPSASATNPNTVTALDPLTGEVTASTWVGSEPDRLSVSDDGRFLYVALRGASSIERLSLPDLVPELSIGLGTDATYGPYYASDLRAAPASPGTIAVSLSTMGSSSASGGIEILDDATPRPTKAGSASYYYPYGSLQWGATSETLYASSTGYGSDLFRFGVDASGVALQSTYRSAFSSYNVGFAFDGGSGLLYGEDGRVVDPATGGLAGTYAVTNLYNRRVVPDSSLGSVFFASGDSYYYSTPAHVQLTAFDLARYVQTRTATVKFVGSPPRRLIRWGTDGLAFLTPERVVLVRGSAVLPPSTTSNPVPAIASVSPSRATAGAANLVVTVTGSGFVRGSTVLWNGSERTTTYASATALVAYVPASDLAAAGAAEVTVASPAPGGGTSGVATFTVDP